MKKIMPVFYIAVVFFVLFSSCGQNTGAKNAGAATGKDSMAASPVADTTKKYTLAMVVNKKDLSCGMPLTAGLEDTAHYKGKAYGFCSKECKDAFLKNPDALIAKIK